MIKLHDDSRDKSQCNDSSPACSVPRLDEGQLQDYCQSLDELQNSDVDFISSSGSAIDFDDNSLPKQSKIDTTQITTAAAADTPEPSTEDEVNSKRHSTDRITSFQAMDKKRIKSMLLESDGKKKFEALVDKANTFLRQESQKNIIPKSHI